MQQAEHEFMDHDSHVDCSQARAYPADAVINELLNHPDWVLGDASKDLKEQMVAALKYAPMIAPADVPELCDALLPPDLNIG